jgi:sulfur relay protein TusB/DsrH
MKSPARDKTCLHLVVRSCREALDNCLSQCVKGDVLLFLDDGVVNVTSLLANPGPHAPQDSAWAADVRFSAVDLEARGLSGLAQAAGVIALPDADIVELVLSHEFCLTWK